MANDFVHLHVHSIFSVRDGIASPASLVEYAKKSGHSALAITDHGNMGGHYQFASAAAATETKDGSKTDPLKAIFGFEAYVCDDILVKKNEDRVNEKGHTKKGRPKHRHLVLLAKNEIGYLNLLRMMSIAADSENGGYYYEPRIDWNLLSKHSDGLVCLSACLAGEVSLPIRNGNVGLARDIADRYRSLFGDDYYLEIQDHNIPEERSCYGEIEKIAKDLKIPLVVTNDVHYTVKIDAATHALLVSMRFKKNEEQGGSSDTRNLNLAYKEPEFYMKDADQMAQLFSHLPDAIKNTVEIAEKCEYEFPLAHSIIWPPYDVPEDRTEDVKTYRMERIPHENDKQVMLTMDVVEGLKKLGLYKNKAYRKRAREELDVIYDLGYEDYFLVQSEICQWARDKQIMMGPGRGSGAGSLVLYLLGVTAIDPIKNDLIFERFLNPGRGPQFDQSLPIPELSKPKEEDNPAAFSQADW